MIRTQVELKWGDGRSMVYWLDQSEGNIVVGDKVEIFEQPDIAAVSRVCVSIPEKTIGVPHRNGTILNLHRVVRSREDAILAGDATAEGWIS